MWTQKKSPYVKKLKEINLHIAPREKVHICKLVCHSKYGFQNCQKEMYKHVLVMLRPLPV